MNTRQKIIVLVGQTASGKTSTAIELAKAVDGEVISADSRQVYKYLNIGSDKVTTEQMQGVPHHLLDVANPLTQTYSVSDFINDAANSIKDIINRGKVPIVAGGTMLYIDTLMGNVLVPEVAPNPKLRKRLQNQIKQRGKASLFEELRKKDSRRAEQMIREGQSDNPRRLIRALEIINELGKVPDKEEAASTDSPLKDFDALWLGLHNDPEIQKERINKRNAEMLNNGLLKEVQGLIDMGVAQKQFDTFGFEYKYPAMYLLGIPIIQDEPPTLEQVLMKMNSGTWRYAKKQRAWWVGRDEINWYKPEDKDNLIQLTKKFLFD